MERVGIYEVKAKLPDLLERAEVIREILAFGKSVKAKPFNLRKAIEQGRK